jgi:hypothetical protein
MLVHPNVAAGIVALQQAGTEISQAVSYVTMAQQAAAPALAMLQSAGAEFAQSASDVKMGMDAAAAALGLGS